MFFVIDNDNKAALCYQPPHAARVQTIAYATGPQEIAYIHIINYILRKYAFNVPQGLSVVGIIEDTPAGKTFSERGIWENKNDAESHYKVIAIPENACGKMMLSLDGTVLCQMLR